ncbi:MAG: cobalamin B12-binding domain-containing protein [Chloroflexi bacterium]|nr:cobalamin B12-binding domain-containing protein [Chloroflexota bacterium]
MTKQLVEAIADMREEDALQSAQEMLDNGVDPLVILDDCREAMAVVGKRFETGAAFIPELIFAGEIMRQLSALVKPSMAETTTQAKLGRVLIGTVHGDIHDIGKDIVTFMLDVNGFQVQDLGVDVPASRFVEAIKEFQPQVVALSGFLTLAFDSMKETVEAIQAAGMRDKVKIMVGGGQVTQDVCGFAGADGFGNNAVAGVSLAKQWIGA